jgi:glycosyltransferase involved in cell wall biosynthesis
MTPEVKLSVVIPVYNRGSEVRRAIDSVLAQSYKHFELLVVDDGSTDNTAEVIQSYTDPRLHYIYQNNSERGAARNRGAKSASGQFITYLDSDDEFLNDHLSKVNQLILAHPGYDVYCTAYYLETEKGVKEISIPENIQSHLLEGNFLSCNGVFTSSEVPEKCQFSEVRSLSGLEDWEYWLRVGASFSMKAGQLFTTRMNHHAGRSVLNTNKTEIENRFREFFKALENEPSVVKFYGSALRRVRTSAETYMALHLAMSKKNRKAAIDHLWRGWKLRPSIIFSRRFYATIKYLF